MFLVLIFISLGIPSVSKISLILLYPHIDSDGLLPEYEENNMIYSELLKYTVETTDTEPENKINIISIIMIGLNIVLAIAVVTLFIKNK